MTVLIPLFSACGSREQDLTAIPSGVLNKEQFRDALVQMALTESAINLNLKSIRAEKVDSAYPFNPLRDLNIRKSLFDSSLHFYAAHPTIYRNVYDSVLTKLNEMRFSRQKISNDSLSK